MDRHYKSVMRLIKEYGGINPQFLEALQKHRDKEHKEELIRYRIRQQHKRNTNVASGGSLPITEDELRYHLKEKKWSLFNRTEFNDEGIKLTLKRNLIHAQSGKHEFYTSNQVFHTMTHTQYLAELNYWLGGVYEKEKIPQGLHYEIQSQLSYNDVRAFLKTSEAIQEGYKRTMKGQNCFGAIIREGHYNRWEFERRLKDHRSIISFKLLETRREKLAA